MTERKVRKTISKILKPSHSNQEEEVSKCKKLLSDVSKKSYEILIQANESLIELNKNIEDNSGTKIEIQNDLPEKCRMILGSLRSKEIENNLNDSAKVSFQDTSKLLGKTLHEMEKNSGMEHLLLKTLKDSICNIKEKFKEKEKVDEEIQVNFEEGANYYLEKLNQIECFYKKKISDIEKFYTQEMKSLKREFKRETIDLIENLNLKVVIQSRYPLKSFECKKDKHTECYIRRLLSKI